MTGGELTRLAGRLDRRKRYIRSTAWLAGSALYVSLAAIPAAFFLGTGYSPLSLGIYLFLAAVPLFCFIIPFFVPNPRSALLARADAFYKTGEKLTAAWELLDNSQKIDPGISDMIRTHGESAAFKIDVKQVFPLMVKKRTRLLFVFLPLVLAALVFNLESLVYGKLGEDLLEQVYMLENEAELFAARADIDQYGESRKIAEELNELSRKLKQEGLSKKEAAEQLTDMSQRVERQIRRLSRDFLPDSSRRELEEKEKIEELLEDFSNRRNTGYGDAAALKQNLLDMETISDEQRAGIEKAFDKLGKNSESDGMQDEKIRDLLDELKQNLTDAADAEDEIENLSELAGKLEGGAEKLGVGSPDSRQEEERTAKGGDGGNDSLGKPGDQEDGLSAAPGQTNEQENRGSEESGFSYREDTGRPGFNLKGVIKEESERRVEVRNLPEESAALLDEEKIIVEYRRRAEAAIYKSEIPLAKRKLIGEYFFRLGVIEE